MPSGAGKGEKVG